LCGSSAEALISAQPLPTETTGRPFVVALGYLLAGFDGFHRLGTFNRLHLASLVFCGQALEQSLREASAVLDQWGYRSVLSAQHRLRGVFSQALLINSSARLEDLTPRRSTGCIATRRPTTVTARCSTRCSARSRARVLPPVRTGYNHAPGIQGTPTAWACHLDADPARSDDVSHRAGQSRAMAGRRTPADPRAGAVDTGDLRGLGRGR